MTASQIQLRSPPRRTATSNTNGLYRPMIYCLFWCFEKQEEKKHRALRGLLLRRDDKYPVKVMNTSPLHADQGSEGMCWGIPGCSTHPAQAKDQGWEGQDGLSLQRSLQGLYRGTWKTFECLCCSFTLLPEAPLKALSITSTPSLSCTITRLSPSPKNI